MEKIGILGIGKSGIAAALKAKNLGYDVFISEDRKQEDCDLDLTKLAGIAYEFGGHTDRILDYPMIIVSPGISPTTPIIQKLRENGNELISEIEFGFRIKHPATKVIAVTGSNGKSTTVSLIYHILNELNIKVALAGNIGIAMTSLPIEKYIYDYLILEVSSFQLELVSEFKPDVAVLLNITPDHLNRYASFADYALAKFNIFKKQTQEDRAIIFDSDRQIKSHQKLIPSQILRFSLKEKSDARFDGSVVFSRFLSIDMDQTSLKGQHNILNIMATLLVLESLPLKYKSEEIQQAFASFKGLAHRLEFIADINGITFVNDSKATNTDSVKYALSAYKQKVRIIMGGSDKGEDYSVLVDSLQLYAKKVYLIGNTAEKMFQQFNKIKEKSIYSSLQEAVNEAYKDSVSGDIIILSPACASFDHFRNFEHRGAKFKSIVESLKANE